MSGFSDGGDTPGNSPSCRVHESWRALQLPTCCNLRQKPGALHVEQQNPESALSKGYIIGDELRRPKLKRQDTVGRTLDPLRMVLQYCVLTTGIVSQRARPVGCALLILVRSLFHGYVEWGIKNAHARAPTTLLQNSSLSTTEVRMLVFPRNLLRYPMMFSQERGIVNPGRRARRGTGARSNP